MTLPTIMCYACGRYYTLSHCRAFPDGIPKEILTGEVDHSKPYKGDHGIQFKAIEK